MSNINFQIKTQEPSITLNIFIFTVKGAGFGTPDHANNHCFNALKIDQILNLTASNLLKLRQCQEFTCEISDVSSEKLCYNACVCEAHRRKNGIKIMVFREVIDTRATIKFCVKLAYKPTEILSLLYGDALEMKKYSV